MFRSIRLLILVALVVVPVIAAHAADSATYLKITGIPGTSESQGRQAWNEVLSFSLILLPPAPDKDNGKILQNRCALAVQTSFGKAGGAAVDRIGDLLTDPVLVEVDRLVADSALRVYRASLSGAKIVSYDGSSNGSLSESLVIHFVEAEVTTWGQNPDGTVGVSTVGTFNCGPMP